MSPQLDLEIPESNGGRAKTFCRAGFGVCTAHYGELFQGQIRVASGIQHRCLFSLPCNGLYSRATFYPEVTTSEVNVKPTHKVRAKQAAELCLKKLKIENTGGVLVLESNIVEAKGCGSSTADCVAAVRSISDAFSRPLSEQQVAKLVVEAETASDNVMFNHAILFAQRRGLVLEDYGVDLPDLEVVGVDTEPDRLVDTLVYPPAVYSREELDCFQLLVSALRRALVNSDITLLGRVSTTSAIINNRFLPKPSFQELRSLAVQAGAAGISVAHSGTVASFLFDPNMPLLDDRIEFLQRELEALGLKDCFRFQTNRYWIREEISA